MMPYEVLLSLLHFTDEQTEAQRDAVNTYPAGNGGAGI